MKIHEFQAKDILSKNGVPVPKARLVSTPEMAEQAVGLLGPRVVIKAQVHAGGRGKAGGIKVACSAKEAREVAESMLGSRLITPQTGVEGIPVRQVLIEEALDIARELYLAIMVDGAAGRSVVIASDSGGTEIEEMAEETPEKIMHAFVDPMLGIQPYLGRKIAYALGVESDQIGLISQLTKSLYDVFDSHDCSLVEINPLVVTSDGRILAADAKIDFDDDAIFKHTEIEQLRDVVQEDPMELQARESNISYVKLEGDIGCIVNGAGLAMATMDVAHAAGAAPANFLDVGGSADEDKVANAMRIILSDKRVKKVLVNIFGGILRCDIVARGILMATDCMPELARPMVVRMQGTNAEEGRRLLNESKLEVVIVEDMRGAAEAIRGT